MEGLKPTAGNDKFNFPHNMLSAKDFFSMWGKALHVELPAAKLIIMFTWSYSKSKTKTRHRSVNQVQHECPFMAIRGMWTNVHNALDLAPFLPNFTTNVMHVYFVEYACIDNYMCADFLWVSMSYNMCESIRLLKADRKVTNNLNNHSLQPVNAEEHITYCTLKQTGYRSRKPHQVLTVS